MNKYENLIIEKKEHGITVLKINRPDALNALNSHTLHEMRGALEFIKADTSTRVLVLTGEGTKSFIAGADISEMNGKSQGEGTVFSRLGHEITRLLEHLPQPTIAAVNGFALGGGTEFAIACDFIVASDNAVFGQPEVGLGVIPGFGGTVRLLKKIGIAQAKEMIFSGRKVKADEAFSMGLVNHVYPSGEFFSKVMDLAKQISLNSFSAVSKAKQLLNEFSEGMKTNFHLDGEALEFGGLFGSPDQIEGMKAFVEKRKPQFEGVNS